MFSALQNFFFFGTFIYLNRNKTVQSHHVLHFNSFLWQMSGRLRRLLLRFLWNPHWLMFELLLAGFTSVPHSHSLIIKPASQLLPPFPSLDLIPNLSNIMAMLRVSSYRKMFEDDRWSLNGRLSVACAGQYRASVRSVWVSHFFIIRMFLTQIKHRSYIA